MFHDSRPVKPRQTAVRRQIDICLGLELPYSGRQRNLMSSQPTVAVMGLGLMGRQMAGRLLEAGFALTVYNRSTERAAELAGKGERVASTPKERAAGAQIVISMLSDDPASRASWLGPDGALAGAASETLLIECSTVSVGWIRELGSAAASQNIELIDAPVTGSRPQAAAGQLVFLVGGEPAALERARPVLSVMGRDMIH